MMVETECDGTVISVAEQSEQLTAVLCVAGSILVRNKYLYGLQLVVSGLAVFAHEFKYFNRGVCV